jgi:hypothetical protein
MMANGDHKVKVGEKEMSVNELVEAYNAMCAKNAEEPEDEEAKKKALEIAEAAEKEKAQNEEDEKAKVEKEKDDKAKNALANAQKLKNAEKEALKIQNEKVIETSIDQVNRGKKRYGSK